MNSLELRELFLNRFSLAGSNLGSMAQCLTQLYGDFRTDVVDRINCTPVSNKPYTWIDPLRGRSHHVILFFHGGGYTMGSTQDHLQLIASLVDQTGISFLGVDYRLLPDHTFPAPLDDAVVAYRWLLEQGFESSRIGLAGISAGATLVSQLIRRCAVNQLGCPGLALVLSGLKDFRYERPSITSNAASDLVTIKRLESIVELYFPDRSFFQSDDVLCFEQSYEHYPRTLFQVGDHELLLSDAIEMFQVLSGSGHDVCLNVVPQMIHCGQLFARDYWPGHYALDQAASFIKQVFPVDS